MFKQSSLSTKSRVFVVSNNTKSSDKNNIVKSAENISFFNENSMVKSDLKQNKCHQVLRKMEVIVNDEECDSECSFHSNSTNGSSRRYESQDNSSERSDNSWNSRFKEVEFCCELYNNDQKTPIRIQKAHRHESEQDLSTRNSDQEIDAYESTTTDSAASIHKKTRRGGRKNRTQKFKNEEKSISDKEAEKYKTELCKNWIEKGKWRYSVRCRFAHGPHELIQSHSNFEVDDYKSKFWLAFHENSHCPYGIRCHFIHENRKICDLTYSYYSKNLLLSEEIRSTLPHKRLRVFESLSGCEE